MNIREKNKIILSEANCLDVKSQMHTEHIEDFGYLATFD